MMEAIPTISHCLDRSLVGFETTPSCCSFSVRRKGNRQGWSDEAPQLLMCQLTCHLQWPRLAVPRGQGSGRPTLTLLCATTSNGMKRECCMAQQHRSDVRLNAGQHGCSGGPTNRSAEALGTSDREWGGWGAGIGHGRRVFSAILIPDVSNDSGCTKGASPFTYQSL